MPVASGSSAIRTTTLATAASGIANSRPTYRSRTSTHTGTITIASSEMMAIDLEAVSDMPGSLALLARQERRHGRDGQGNEHDLD